MSTTRIVTISVTELPHFERIIQFICDVDDYAHREVDLELQGIVEDCRSDLLTIRDEES